jgi:hypothetical protein
LNATSEVHVAGDLRIARILAVHLDLHRLAFTDIEHAAGKHLRNNADRLEPGLSGVVAARVS